VLHLRRRVRVGAGAGRAHAAAPPAGASGGAGRRAEEGEEPTGAGPQHARTLRRDGDVAGADIAAVRFCGGEATGAPPLPGIRGLGPGRLPLLVNTK